MASKAGEKAEWDAKTIASIERFLNSGQLSLLALEEIVDRRETRYPSDVLKAVKGHVAGLERQVQSDELQQRGSATLAADAAQAMADQNVREALAVRLLAATDSEIAAMKADAKTQPFVMTHPGLYEDVCAALDRRQVGRNKMVLAVLAMAAKRLAVGGAGDA